jgi:hypothetical protein
VPSSAGSSRASSVSALQVATQAVAEVKEPLSAELLLPFTQALLAVAASPRRLSRDAIDDCESIGSQAALDGVSLSSLVDGFLSACRIVWVQSLAHSTSGSPVARREIVDSGEAMFKAADAALAAVARGFGHARRAMVRQQESERREFIDDLLSGSGDTAAVISRAERFGLRIMAPHVVVVATADDAFRDDSGVVIDLETKLRGRLPRIDMLVATKDGRLVVVLGQRGDRERPRAEQGRLFETLLREVRRHVSDESSVRLSVGPALEGPAGIPTSYRAARRGTELSEKLGWAEPIVMPSQVAVYDVLLRDRQALTSLVRSVLGPLTSARGGAVPLLTTLLAYFECGAVATETARATNLSVRAVTYRLGRIRNLTAWDPTNPAHWLTLHTAAEGARLLGWPEEPP